MGQQHSSLCVIQTASSALAVLSIVLWDLLAYLYLKHNTYSSEPLQQALINKPFFCFTTSLNSVICPINEASELQLQQPEGKGTCTLRSHRIRQHCQPTKHPCKGCATLFAFENGEQQPDSFYTLEWSQTPH